MQRVLAYPAGSCKQITSAYRISNKSKIINKKQQTLSPLDATELLMLSNIRGMQQNVSTQNKIA